MPVGNVIMIDFKGAQTDLDDVGVFDFDLRAKGLTGKYIGNPSHQSHVGRRAEIAKILARLGVEHYSELPYFKKRLYVLFVLARLNRFWVTA